MGIEGFLLKIMFKKAFCFKNYIVGYRVWIRIFVLKIELLQNMINFNYLISTIILKSADLSGCAV